MVRIALLFIFVLAGFSGNEVVGKKNSSIEQYIWNQIGGNSGGLFIPRSGKKPVVMNISITLVSLSDYDHAMGTMRVGYWLDLKWTHPTLKWDPDAYDGVMAIHIPSTDIWVPDVVPYVHTDTAHAIETRVIIFHDGTIIWVPHLMTTTICEDVIDGPRFPRDQKTCVLQIGSWVYDGNTLKLQLEKGSFQGHSVSSSPLRSNGWQYVNVTEKFKIMKYGDLPEPYPSIELDIIIRRADTYFSMAVSVPGVISGLLVSLLYLMAPTSSGRVISQTVCLLILVFVAVTDLRLMGSTALLAPAAHYFMAAMVLDLFAIVWSIAIGIVWMQASAKSAHANASLNSVLNGLECICLLPSIVAESDAQELRADDESTPRRAFGLSAVQRLCLVLDRLFCVVNFILFIILFVYLGA